MKGFKGFFKKNFITILKCIGYIGAGIVIAYVIYTGVKAL